MILFIVVASLVAGQRIAYCSTWRLLFSARSSWISSHFAEHELLQ